MRISVRKAGRDRHEGNKRRFMIWLFMITAVSFAATLWADAAMRPVIEDIVAYQARVQAARIVNNAVITQLDQEDISYNRIVKLTRLEDGEVISIEADMVQINKLKSRIGNAVIESLADGANHDIHVPAGTLIGNQFTSGRGPTVVIKTVPTGYVQSEIYSLFSAAGINQTLHRIMLDINVQMIAVLPGYSVKTETVSSFCIAETVIVGKIPQGYASIGGESPTFAAIEG